MKGRICLRDDELDNVVGGIFPLYGGAGRGGSADKQDECPYCHTLQTFKLEQDGWHCTNPFCKQLVKSNNDSLSTTRNVVLL